VSAEELCVGPGRAFYAQGTLYAKSGSRREWHDRAHSRSGGDGHTGRFLSTALSPDVEVGKFAIATRALQGFGIAHGAGLIACYHPVVAGGTTVATLIDSYGRVLLHGTAEKSGHGMSASVGNGSNWPGCSLHCSQHMSQAAPKRSLALRGHVRNTARRTATFNNHSASVSRTSPQHPTRARTAPLAWKICTHMKGLTAEGSARQQSSLLPGGSGIQGTGIGRVNVS
jgi:hypothetical protein